MATSLHGGVGTALVKMELRALASEANFDEQAYLDENPDVAAAVDAGWLSCGRAHFDLVGRSEGRKLGIPGREAQLTRMRDRKLRHLERHFRSDLARRSVAGRPSFLTAELEKIAGIAPTEFVSANSYDPDLWALIEADADGLILDCGAGRRDMYLSNVVNYEIVPYDTTDVLGVAEVLPFQDHTFDGIISVAVLEHVKYPFQCAREICRVLKPGGWLYCCVPFLQPYHGYPHHYFNMTHQGVRVLFESAIDIERQYVNPALTPIWSLCWIVGEWAASLPADLREAFLDLSLRDLASGAAPHADAPYVRALSETKKLELASATILVGRRRPGMVDSLWS
jgi:SAM-dependent methyltransferase